MNIDELLDELENLLIDASRVPFTNKRVVEEDDLARIIDGLRDALPKDIAEAKQIVSERKRILEDAQREGQNIIEQAKNYVMKLTDENVITQQAQEHASSIIAEAQKAARELQTDAIGYADSVFKHLEANIEEVLGVVRAAHGSLQKQRTEKQETHAS